VRRTARTLQLGRLIMSSGRRWPRIDRCASRRLTGQLKLQAACVVLGWGWWGDVAWRGARCPSSCPWISRCGVVVGEARGAALRVRCLDGTAAVRADEGRAGPRRSAAAPKFGDGGGDVIGRGDTKRTQTRTQQPTRHADNSRGHTARHTA